MSDNLIAIAVYQQASSGDHDLEHDGTFWRLIEGDDETDALAEEFIQSIGEDKINEPLHFTSAEYLFVIERIDDEQVGDVQRSEIQGGEIQGGEIQDGEMQGSGP